VQVLAKAQYDPNHDKLFLLGDYVDRGSDVKFTVDLVRQLVMDGAIALKGNHDAMQGEVTCGLGSFDWWVHQNGGSATVKAYGGFPPADVLLWLDNLPLYHEEPDCILVHAGVFPELPLDEQNPNNFLWIRGEFYNNYRGPKTVIFGHTPTPHLWDGGVPESEQWKPWRGNHCVGIDTGAAYGGPLTLVDIDTWQTWTA
jgi:serine/threonine protein phosphatase 1